MSIGWRDIKVDGKPACFVDIDGKRLYINQRNDEAFSAFVDGVQVGKHYDTVSAAQAAALRAIGVRPPPDPLRFSATHPARQAAPSAPELPIARLEADGTTITFLDAGGNPPELVELTRTGRKKPVREETVAQLKAFPIADLSQPVTAPTIEVKMTDIAISRVVVIEPGCCGSCGTRLGRSGKCPALCTPVEKDPPAYTGPMKVGRTHTARLGAPVSWS